MLLGCWIVRLWQANFLCPAPDLWLTGDHFMGELSAMGQPPRQTLLSLWG